MHIYKQCSMKHLHCLCECVLQCGCCVKCFLHCVQQALHMLTAEQVWSMLHRRRSSGQQQSMSTCRTYSSNRYCVSGLPGRIYTAKNRSCKPAGVAMVTWQKCVQFRLESTALMTLGVSAIVSVCVLVPGSSACTVSAASAASTVVAAVSNILTALPVLPAMPTRSKSPI